MKVQWKHKGKTYRIIQQIRKEYIQGYEEPTKVYYNLLQVKLSNPLAILVNCGTWKSLKQEEIPFHVKIEMMKFAGTTWRSSLVERCQRELNAPSWSI